MADIKYSTIISCSDLTWGHPDGSSGASVYSLIWLSIATPAVQHLTQREAEALSHLIPSQVNGCCLAIGNNCNKRHFHAHAQKYAI